MKKMLLSLVILAGMSVGAFATVQEDVCLYSTSTVISVSSWTITTIAPVYGQKNIEIQNMDTTNSIIICSSSSWVIGTIPGPVIVAGESRIWENFNGAFCLIAYPDKSNITVGITRQMYRKHPANY